MTPKSTFKIVEIFSEKDSKRVDENVKSNGSPQKKILKNVSKPNLTKKGKEKVVIPKSDIASSSKGTNVNIPKKDPSFMKNQSFFKKPKQKSQNFTQHNTTSKLRSQSYKSTNRDFSNVIDNHLRKGSRVSKENGTKEGVCPPPFAPKYRFAKNRFSNVDVFRRTNRLVTKTSFNSDGCVNSMNSYANVARCGNCCCLGANDFGHKRHAYNWFGYYDDSYYYPMHDKSKKTKPKKRSPKKEKVAKQAVTPNQKGPIYKWVLKPVST